MATDDEERGSETVETLGYASAAAAGTHPLWLARDFVLTGGSGRENNANWERAGHWLGICGLLLGVLYAVVFRASWRWFGEYQYIRFIPIAIVLSVDVAWGGYRPLVAAVKLLSRSREERDPLRPVVLAVLIILLKYAMLVSLPLGEAEWPGWRARLGFLYPKPIYRPLVLMPLWGWWAASLSLCLGRVHPDAPAYLVRMATGMRLRWVGVQWFAWTLLTVLYASEAASDLAQGVVVALGILLAAYLVSFFMARRYRGQSEETILATVLATQFAFLVLYLPMMSNIFHY